MYFWVSGVFAANLLLSSLQVFQPERASINGLGPSTRTLTITSPSGSQSTLKLELDDKNRLQVDSKGAAGVFVVRNKVLISPPAAPEEGDHDALLYASTPRRPLPLEAGDFVLALVAHDTNVPTLTINEMRSLFEGNIGGNYVKRSRRLAEFLQNHNASFVSAMVRDPSKDHINSAFSIINFFGQVELSSGSSEGSSSSKLRNHRDGRPSDYSLGRRHSLASQDLVEHLEVILGKQHEEVKKREELLKPIDLADIQTLHTEFYTPPATHHRPAQNLVVASTTTSELRDSSEGVRRRQRPADKHVFAQMIARETKGKDLKKQVKKPKERPVEEEESDEGEKNEEVKPPKAPTRKQLKGESGKKVPSLKIPEKPVVSILKKPTVVVESSPRASPTSPLRQESRSMAPQSQRTPITRTTSLPLQHPPPQVIYIIEQPAYVMPLRRTRVRGPVVEPHVMGGYFYI